jgi:hypothetical protein
MRLPTRSLRAVLLSALLVFAAAPGLAQARDGHGGGHGGGHWGGFGWGLGIAAAVLSLPFIAARSAYYDYAPYGYAPAYSYGPDYGATFAQPAYAPQYQAPAQPQASAGYWYFCASSNGYYPYVRHCAEGWQRVSPTPPGN